MRAEGHQVDIEDEFPPVQAGLLRILARRDDTEILIIHDEDREVGAGERVAFEEIFNSIEVAKAVSHFCSARLMSIGVFRPDRDGWHPFAVSSLKTLVADAKTHLNVTFFPPLPKPPSTERQAWTGERIARLATMATDGYTAKAIADDPQIRSTPTAVYKAAQRFSVLLSERPRGLVSIRLPLDDLAFYANAAARLNLTRDAYIRRVLIAHAQARVPEPA